VLCAWPCATKRPEFDDRHAGSEREHERLGVHNLWSRQVMTVRRRQAHEQSDLRTMLHQSRDYVEMRIQEQEEELRARNAREQAVLQKRLSKGPRDKSPRED
jgi:hypothetical protein